VAGPGLADRGHQRLLRRGWPGGAMRAHDATVIHPELGPGLRWAG
jgi:hypothetical protein